MTPLTQKFVDSCPIESGFRMRGLEMTRLEVFIYAAVVGTHGKAKTIIEI